MIAATDAADLLNALRGYVWIALVGIALWRLFPVLRQRLERDDISAEIAGQKLSLQGASTQLHSQIDDLRSQVIALTERVDASPEVPPDERDTAPPGAPSPPARILWVDDHPENNAFLIKSLEDRGAEVIEVTSTSDALSALSSNASIDVVISDMGRDEPGGFQSRAGISLIEALAAEGRDTPVVVYASDGAVAQFGRSALEAGAAAVTASPTELLTLLRIGPTTAFEETVAEVARRHVGARPFPIRRSVDFVAQRAGERIGIEVKNWRDRPSQARFQQTVDVLDEARRRHRFDRIVVVVKEGISMPDGVEVPNWMTVVTVDELVASVA